MESDERLVSPPDLKNPFFDDLRAAAAASAVARGDANPFDPPAQAEESKLCAPSNSLSFLQFAIYASVVFEKSASNYLVQFRFSSVVTLDQQKVTL
jgi:hypothetical protein